MYIFSGSSYSNNGDVTENHGNNDSWLVKIDRTGDIIWQRSFGGSENEGASSFLQTSEGGYIFAGATYSNDGDASGLHGDKDGWVVKLKEF